MKKMSLIIAGGISLFLLAQTVFAATTPTPTSNPTVSTTAQQIDNLKDKIASSVASMHLVEKKGFIGTVTDISETQITITDMQGNQRIIDVDELTNFSSPTSNSSFGISDITKGMTIGVVGLYNKDSGRLLARWVDVLDLPTVISGGIVSIDNVNYTFTVATEDNTTASIDVEDITKTNSYTQAGGVVKSGFSKLTTGQRVMVVGYPDATNKNLTVASRILVFPGLPVDPKISLINPTDTAPVSTGSGKKLTPITK